MSERKQKRFESEQEITALIDKARAELEAIPSIEAEHLRFAACLLKWMNDNPVESCTTDEQRGCWHQMWNWQKAFKDDAEKVTGRVPRLVSKLEKLKQTLAAFNTMTMPGIVGDDQGVVAAK